MTKYNGLIQHSFALRIDDERRPFRKGTDIDRIRERFAPPNGRVDDFAVTAGTLAAPHGAARVASHSPLTEGGRVNTCPVRHEFLGDRELPRVLRWAEEPKAGDTTYAEEPRFTFARVDEHGGERIECNDFIVHDGDEGDPGQVSSALLETLGHRRSRLFGLSLAGRIVNVMLPHATLTRDGREGRAWLLHPMVTLIRDGRDHSDFSRTFSLTCFLVPVDEATTAKRPVSKSEIRRMVNAGWCLATAPPDADIPRFEVAGRLLQYISNLSACGLTRLVEKSVDTGGTLTLRQLTEIVAFGVAVSVAQGSAGHATRQTLRRIGDDVVTSLGSARVSSVLVVDQGLTRQTVCEPVESLDPPDALLPLMRTLSRENRPPHEPWSEMQRRRYRLDRPFVDDDGYVVGLLPRNRCLVVVSVGAGQHGTRESGLMQAASAAYMTIGAASAIGTMRAIDRELERMEGEDPRKIADIDGEIAADLHDLYDLDITREAFRNIYRLMRQRLGINRDFETLKSKMEALYRATSTNEAVRSQRQLMWLTVVLAVLTVLVILKPGG